MEIQAIYDKGKLEFSIPIRFRKDRVPVMVTVPDDAVDALAAPHDLPREVIALADRMRERLDRVRNAPLPPDAQLPPVSEKSIERISAYALREDR